MSDNTDVQGNQPEDSSVIEGFREREKALKKELKEQEQRIRAEIKREADANALMPDAFKGLAGYFAQEVEGELTAEAAAEWLASKGVAASPEPATPQQESPAEALAAVTDLGASVAAASDQSGANVFNEKLGEIEKAAGNAPGNLNGLTAQIAQALEG